MLKHIFTLICLPLLCFAGALPDDGKLSIAPPAPWVVPCDFELDSAELGGEHVQYLLIDKQKNWAEKTSYKHVVVKALSQAGVDKISKISIDFEPSFRRAVVHNIRLFRDGVESDRLESAEHHLLQQEVGLDHGIYVGDLTAVYLLEDIRVGDVVEYSYSLIGQNPLFTSHYTDMIYLQYSAPVEKLSYRLLSDPSHSFAIRPSHTTLEVTVRDLSPTTREWKWETRNTPPYTHEPDEPIWYSSSPHIEISEYESWEQVGAQISPLFAIPDDFDVTCPEEMQDLVETWQAMTSDPKELALFALRFVQDEIRYLGLEEGVAGFKPNDPRLVFERRFGDCKDKSCLLQALLYMMGIDSTPLLVNSHRGELIADGMPTPFAFDHAVLRIEFPEAYYYVDPTLQLQGGSLDTTCSPAYYYALLLSQDAPELISFPRTVPQEPIEIETQFQVTSRDSVTYSKNTLFRGPNADMMRYFLDAFGEKDLADDALNALREMYGSAKVVIPFQILDDREANCIQIQESYTLPTRTKAKGKTLKFFSSAIDDFLDTHINPERESPYALVYPLWVREHVRVDNPFNVQDDSSDERIYEQESIFFAYTLTIEGGSSDYYFELKHLQDHVPHNALRDYWELCQEIIDNAPQELTITNLRRSFSKMRLRG